jgi:hypothetical protein
VNSWEAARLARRKRSSRKKRMGGLGFELDIAVTQWRHKVAWVVGRNLTGMEMNGTMEGEGR